MDGFFRIRQSIRQATISLNKPGNFSAVSNLRVTQAGANQITLTWFASTVGEVGATQESYQIGTLVNGQFTALTFGEEGGVVFSYAERPDNRGRILITATITGHGITANTQLQVRAVAKGAGATGQDMFSANARVNVRANW